MNSRANIKHCSVCGEIAIPSRIAKMSRVRKHVGEYVIHVIFIERLKLQKNNFRNRLQCYEKLFQYTLKYFSLFSYTYCISEEQHLNLYLCIGLIRKHLISTLLEVLLEGWSLSNGFTRILVDECLRVTGIEHTSSTTVD
jgi:hypothetical protein